MSSDINALLDRAKEKTGSDYKTAQLLGITRGRLSDWRHGKQNAQPEDFALVAKLAGLDAEEALIGAVLAKHADTPKGERLKEALSKALSGAHAMVALAVCLAVSLFAPARSDAAGWKPMRDNVYYVK